MVSRAPLSRSVSCPTKVLKDPVRFLVFKKLKILFASQTQ
jgi:hypothetical protein